MSIHPVATLLLLLWRWCIQEWRLHWTARVLSEMVGRILVSGHAIRVGRRFVKGVFV